MIGVWLLARALFSRRLPITKDLPPLHRGELARGVLIEHDTVETRTGPTTKSIGFFSRYGWYDLHGKLREHRSDDPKSGLLNHSFELERQDVFLVAYDPASRTTSSSTQTVPPRPSNACGGRRYKAKNPTFRQMMAACGIDGAAIYSEPLCVPGCVLRSSSGPTTSR
ncbi:MAG: hypothetical protein Q8K32_02770 [Archangium sp.]|nr:hypothetical protein [Archangium sp.]MDP3572556.1 hypothetical protein [Archangium sp.]